MSKLLFRPQRGSLAKAMEQVTEITDMDSLVSAIKLVYEYNGKVEDIKLKSYGYDNRIKWETYIVTGKFGGERGVLGFTNGNLKQRYETRTIRKDEGES